MSNKFSTSAKVLGLCLLTAMFTGCEEAAEETTSPSVGGVSLVGTYKTNCQAVSGSPDFGGTHWQYQMYFRADGTGEFNKIFANSATCSDIVFQSIQSFSSTVGSATSTPANGYNITFAVSLSAIVGWQARGGHVIADVGNCAGQGSWSSSGSNKALTVYSGGFNCARITTAGAQSFYNVIVANGSTLQLGVPLNDNVGVVSAGSVNTSSALTFTKQ